MEDGYLETEVIQNNEIRGVHSFQSVKTALNRLILYLVLYLKVLTDNYVFPLAYFA
jgi:hypothetical protein